MANMLRKLRSALQIVWGKWPPGVCIAMLALLAALFPVFAAAVMTPRQKAMWTSGFLLLLLLELLIIFKERARQDSDYLAQIERIDGLRRASDAHNTSMMRVFMAANDPVEGLKRRALDLSESIFNFSYDRIRDRPQAPMSSSYWPPVPPGGTGQSDIWAQITSTNRRIGEIAEYDKTTGRLFVARFGIKVAKIRNEFAVQGTTDEALDECAALGEAIMSDQIATVAERLGLLAEGVLQKSLTTR